LPDDAAWALSSKPLVDLRLPMPAVEARTELLERLQRIELVEGFRDRLAREAEELRQPRS
jgi:hypothetical protein